MMRRARDIAAASFRAMRPAHWAKNVIVLAPMLLSGRALDADAEACVWLGFAAFCCAASAVYVINDLADAERDRAHPTKCTRPIASGALPESCAKALAVALLAAAALCTTLAGSWVARCTLAAYMALNAAYCGGAKDVALLDIAILSSGYVLRLFYGGAVCDVEISGWLYLTVLAGSVYMGLGKRAGELDGTGVATRAVLASYTRDFLAGNARIYLGLAIGFYALWAKEAGGAALATVPAMMLTCLRYSFAVEIGGISDPVEAIVHDKWVVALACIWVALTVVPIYAR